MTDLFPVPDDWDERKTLLFTKREMMQTIFKVTDDLREDVSEFDRYWNSVSPVQRDLFIANLVEGIFK